MVAASRLLVAPTLFLYAYAGIFDQDLRNAGSHSVRHFENVSAARVAEVREMVNQWWEMSALRLKDIDNMMKNFKTLVTVVPFMIFAYLMLYSYADRFGPWKATVLAVMLALAVDQYL